MSGPWRLGHSEAMSCRVRPSSRRTTRHHVWFGSSGVPIRRVAVCQFDRRASLRQPSTGHHSRGKCHHRTGPDITLSFFHIAHNLQSGQASCRAAHRRTALPACLPRPAQTRTPRLRDEPSARPQCCQPQHAGERRTLPRRNRPLRTSASRLAEAGWLDDQPRVKKNKEKN